ncbi:MAG: phosphotransferase [Deltaproteobacteria bacterium]|nr:phosphotransferase [Candidatus Zymogenaceae bacterium]
MKEIEDREHLVKVARRFDVGGDVSSIVRHATGHINHTYIVTAGVGRDAERCILQRINTDVFTDPAALMDNILQVTGAVSRRVEDRGGDPRRESLTLVMTTDDDHSHVCDRGGFWRCYRLVEGKTHNAVPTGPSGIDLARSAACAFRRFQRDIASLDTTGFHEPIRDFHNTPARYRAFEEALHGDVCKRAGEVIAEIDFCRERRDLCDAITRPLELGEIPQRLVHNDTKINNIIFQNGASHSSRKTCVIDLDTVMPGSVLFDFGDQVRTTVSHAEEDERDLEKVRLEQPLFEALVAGYLSEAEDFLTDREKGLLVTAGLVITFETGLRFLTDYLMGDCYFHIIRPGHNLDRARTQFCMVELMEKSKDGLESIVHRYT